MFLVARNPCQFVAQHSLTLAVPNFTVLSHLSSSSHGTSRKALSLSNAALPRPPASSRNTLHYFSARNRVSVSMHAVDACV